MIDHREKVYALCSESVINFELSVTRSESQTLFPHQARSDLLAPYAEEHNSLTELADTLDSLLGASPTPPTPHTTTHQAPRHNLTHNTTQSNDQISCNSSTVTLTSDQSAQQGQQLQQPQQQAQPQQQQQHPPLQQQPAQQQTSSAAVLARLQEGVQAVVLLTSELSCVQRQFHTSEVLLASAERRATLAEGALKEAQQQARRVPTPAGEGADDGNRDIHRLVSCQNTSSLLMSLCYMSLLCCISLLV